MPSVILRDHESIDSAMRRFKRAIDKCGVITESRRRQRFEKPKTKRRRKKIAAVKRQLKRTSKENFYKKQRRDVTKGLRFKDPIASIEQTTVLISE